MASRVAVITRDKHRQHEALRTALGLLLEHHTVSLFVLRHEIDCTEQYLENLEFVDEMGGSRYSDLAENVKRHGFCPVSLQEAGQLLARHDLIIPF